MTIHYNFRESAACGAEDALLLALTAEHVTCPRCREIAADLAQDIEAIIDGCVPQDMLPARVVASRR